MDSTNFDKMFNRKAAEYLNANGKKDDDLMEREVRIPEHMLPKKIILDDDDADADSVAKRFFSGILLAWVL